MLRANPFFKRFRCSRDADYHNGGIYGGFADSVAGNASKVRLRTERGENDDVVRLVADDDLKARGKIRIFIHPHAKLCVGCDNDFFRRHFSPSDAAARRFDKEGVGQGQGFVLRQASIAVLRVNQEQGFTR